MTTPPFDDRAPADDRITPYDERHFVTYLRILDAAKEGGDWREVVSIVFSLDATAEPDRARLVYDSHLERAHWMTSHGYRHLFDKSREA
nr:L372 [uncultured bacterium]